MTKLTFAANNGEMGGGEVMLLRMAESARRTGVEVEVVGPTHPASLIETAEELGFRVAPLPATTRRQYLLALRAWDKSRTGLLWCNGLLPAVATAGHAARVVHLHQLPASSLQRAALRAARLGCEQVVVPSQFMATRLPGATVLANWTDDLPSTSRPRQAGSACRVGFLGRLSQDKGVDLLAVAIGALNDANPGSVELVLAGDFRFVPRDQEAAVRTALSRMNGTVRELGWVSREQFFASVDLAAFPSASSESFGLVAAEAMAARVPLVVSDAGALPEVVGPRHPWVARAGDASDLARVIRSAFEADSAPAVEQARRRWEIEYSPAVGRVRFVELLRRLALVEEGRQ